MIRKRIPYKSLSKMQDGDELEIILTNRFELRYCIVKSKAHAKLSPKQIEQQQKFKVSHKASLVYVDRVTERRKRLLRAKGQLVPNYVHRYLMEHCLVKDPNTGLWAVDESLVPEIFD